MRLMETFMMAVKKRPFDLDVDQGRSRAVVDR
jgi:hypothetical protein